MRKKQIIFLGITLLLFCGCTQNADFEQVVKSVEQHSKSIFFQINENDSLSYISPSELVGENNFENSLNFYENKLKVLNDFNPKKLNEKNQLLLEKTKKDVEQKIEFYSDDLKTNPTLFSIVSVLKKEVEYIEYSEEEQFAQILKRIGQMPSYFSKAKKIIQNPSKENLKIAQIEFSKNYFYLKNELPLLIRKPDILKEAQIDFSQKNDKAQLAIKDFIAFLNSQLFELNDKQ